MWDDPKALNTIALMLVACALATLIATAVLWASRQPAFAIQRVVVRGELKEVNSAHIRAIARESLRGTFFTVNLDSARAAFAQIPWVRNVSVRRVWPDQLEVTLIEHVPLARWAAFSGEAALVNTHGEVFHAHYARELPAFAGPDGTAGEVAARYGEFRHTLSQVGRRPIAVRLSPRRGWELRLDDDLVLALGGESAAERLERFAALYPTTIARITSRVDYVDLRYRNGFAARVAGFKERAKQERVGHKV